MRKVVYNSTFGGYALTQEAVLLGRKLSNNPNWGELVLKGEKYPNGTINEWADEVFPDDNILPRHDPILVQVVETLGKVGDLAITEVKHKYRIHEYDGAETVIEPEDDVYID